MNTPTVMNPIANMRIPTADTAHWEVLYFANVDMANAKTRVMTPYSTTLLCSALRKTRHSATL
jgi:hypothetical protein